jgi:hypothetical protein
MEVTYHLNESEFDLNVFEAIKTAFKNRLLKISVETRENGVLAVSKKKHEYAATIPYDELSKMADALDDDESFDLMSALQQYKVSPE